MDDNRPDDAPPPDSGRPKRAPPTIDLEASDVTATGCGRWQRQADRPLRLAVVCRDPPVCRRGHKRRDRRGAGDGCRLGGGMAD